MFYLLVVFYTSAGQVARYNLVKFDKFKEDSFTRRKVFTVRNTIIYHYLKFVYVYDSLHGPIY